MNKVSVQFVKISSLQEGQRIDNFLLKQLKGVPKSHVYRILRKGEVRVNKKRAKPEYRLQVDDEVRIPPLRLEIKDKVVTPSARVQTLLTDCILYEDNNLIIINKPAGLAVHGGSGIKSGVIEILRSMRPQEPFLELAHRLDRETSGCLLLVKKPSILKEVHKLLREGEVDKRYLALVKGHWPKHLHIVDEPLMKFQLRSGERMVNVHPEGKPSLTEFRVMERFASTTLVEAKPKTGRTHQIRVHALQMGHPIIGDDKYGDKEANKELSLLGCKRLFLHAASLSFNLSNGQQIFVEAKLDEALHKTLVKLK
jgi:23S rRNA pseudouridine955/2504/2580 synthase